MARSNLPRIPTIPKNIQHFVASVVLIVFLPLLPLLLEYWLLSRISAQSLTLTTAIYAISIGASSTQAVVLVLAIPVSIAFSAAFGVVISVGDPPKGCSIAAALTILAAALIHMGERWNRHVAEEKPFWRFW